MLEGTGVVGRMLENEDETDDDGDGAENEGNDSAKRWWLATRPGGKQLGTAEAYWATVWKVTPKSSSSIRQISSSSMSATSSVGHLVMVGG